MEEKPKKKKIVVPTRVNDKIISNITTLSNTLNTLKDSTVSTDLFKQVIGEQEDKVKKTFENYDTKIEVINQRHSSLMDEVKELHKRLHITAAILSGIDILLVILILILM